MMDQTITRRSFVSAAAGTVAAAGVAMGAAGALADEAASSAADEARLCGFL